MIDMDDDLPDCAAEGWLVEVEDGETYISERQHARRVTILWTRLLELEEAERELHRLKGSTTQH